MSDGAHTWVAPYLMPRSRPAEHPTGQPVRTALGYNARGEWVWQDDAEQWPYGHTDLSDAHEMALRGLTDG